MPSKPSRPRSRRSPSKGLCLPFGIDRTSGKTLSLQLAEGLRNAIFAGEWNSGDVLPSRAAIAGELGIGDNTVRAAIGRLAAEGLLRPRPRIGAVVVRKKGGRLSGRVLHISDAGMGAYYLSLFASELRNAINSAGLHYSQVSIPKARQNGKGGGWLADELALKPDICIVEANIDSLPGTIRRIERSGTPYVVVSVAPMAEKFGRGFLGAVFHDQRAALDAFAKDCADAKVCSVCQFNFGVDWNFDAKTRLQRVGVNVETVNAAAAASPVTLHDFMAAGRLALSRRIASGPLPDLLLFSDDYMAIGALPCLAEHGLRVGEDVFAVVHSNRGFEPAFQMSLARIETDPYAVARRTADAVSAWFRCGRRGFSESVECRYVRGDSFRPRHI